MSSVAEYFDAAKFESSASKIWKLERFSQNSNWTTSLYFVPESDISHFNFYFHVTRTEANQITIRVNRERSLISSDLLNENVKKSQLMIQLLLIDDKEKQLNLSKFIVNLFENNRLDYDRFEKKILVDAKIVSGALNSGDILKLRIGGGILKNSAQIPDGIAPSSSDYSSFRFPSALAIPQKISFSNQLWAVPNFSQLKVSELILPVSSPILGVKTNLHLDLFRHEDTNRLTVGIRREKFFIKEDVIAAFQGMKIYIHFAFVNQLDSTQGKKLHHFQEIVMSFFENERSNYGNHVKEFIVEEEILQAEKGLLCDNQLLIDVKAAVIN